MIDIDSMEHHPISEQIVEVLCSKTQNDNPLFFRVLVGYYFSVVASMMRTTIATHDRGDIPVNMYALNLSPSGTGKGFSTNIIENQIINLFRDKFTCETFPALAATKLPQIALKRATRDGTDPDQEIIKVEREFNQLGSLVFSFDSGTPAAVKQMRHKLLMADGGSMNLQIDEIGSNLVGNLEVLNTFLELYDIGNIKQKLIKNTTDNTRNEEIVGRTPTNMMMFGTPSKLLNGSKTEEELYSMFETGYARRCYFGYCRSVSKANNQSAIDVYNALSNQQSNVFLDNISKQLENLADITNMNRRLSMSKDTSLMLIEYRLQCERIAESFPEHEEMKKAEISHRYFKALKLAGAYAFIDDSPELTQAHLAAAIKLAEESGEAFNRLLSRDRNWVKLAKYIASIKREVTQADLVEDLPFYRGAASQKAEMLTLAIAYGYNNNIIIKKSFVNGIEFLKGETLDQTDLNSMILSYSNDIAVGYSNELAPFDQLHKLTNAPNLHWTSHHMVDGHRTEENSIAGFNMIVLDVDKGVSLATVKALMKNHKYLIYTTKRHTDTDNRFRIVLPINYKLLMDAKDFKEFMNNIYDWLPFEVDRATNQRARKWLTHDGYYEYNDGEMIDALQFIPKTSKNEERKQLLNSQQSMDNLERWVINSIGDGNRNNMMLRYAMILTDAGLDFDGVRSKVLELNNKIPDKLDEAEITSTIMISVAKAIAKRPEE